MSDTPETDELNKRLDYSLTDAYLLMTKHSRKLERERNRCQYQLDAILDQVGAMREQMINAERKRDEWKVEAERWRTIANDYRN